MIATPVEENRQNIPCDNSAICDKYVNDEVVVLEDHESASEAAKDVIKQELHWNIITVEKKEDAIKTLENKKITFFIFDNCIGKKRNEGLDALEQVRQIDSEVFVAIYSVHNPEETEKQAKKLEANLFKKKTTDPHKDIREIVSEFIKYKQDLFKNKTNEQLKYLEQKSNINFDAYEKALLDKNWLRKYQNTYVAFVDGQFVDSDFNKLCLLKRLNDSKEYVDKQKFFIKVKENFEKEKLQIIEEPSGSWQYFVR